MTSERRNLPSASGLERIALCTGSWLMERDLPELPDREWTESGTRMHRRLAGEPVALDDAEEETVGKCEILLGEAEIAAGVENEWTRNLCPDRLWTSNYSGKPDYIATSPSGLVALIVDYKTGWLDTDPAPSNWQLRGYAVLIYLNSEVETVTVAIIGKGLTLAKYTEKDLADSYLEIRELIQKALTPGQRLTPGEKQCRYCRALGVCPAARKAALAVAKELVLVPELKPTKADLSTRASLLPSETLAAALDRIALANLVIDALKAEAKSRLSDGLEVPGWQLKPGAEREKITDLSGVWSRLKPLGVDEWDFVRQCSLSKTNLSDMLRKATGEKGKALSARMEQVIDGCVEVTTCEPSLERVKE